MLALKRADWFFDKKSIVKLSSLSSNTTCNLDTIVLVRCNCRTIFFAFHINFSWHLFTKILSFIGKNCATIPMYKHASQVISNKAPLHGPYSRSKNGTCTVVDAVQVRYNIKLVFNQF